MGHRALRVIFAVWIAATTGAVYAAEREVMVETDDGRSLTASLWEAEEKSPTILLLHDCEGSRSMYSDLGSKLEQAGFRVLAPDLPGLGQDAATAEVEAAFQYLDNLAGVLGAGCGGHEAIRLGTAHPEIPRVALLSTPLDSLGERDAMKLSSKLLLVAAKGDTPASRPAGTLAYRRRSAATLELVEGNARGQELLAQESTLPDAIVEWFDQDSQ